MKHMQNPIRLALLAMLAAPAATLATPVPVGGSTVGAEIILSQSMARNASGETALAWFQVNGLAGTSEIYFQLISPTGTPVTSSLPVTGNWYGSPAVAVDSDGDAVVAWVSGGQPGPYSNTNVPATVYAQLYGPDGTAKGSPINVGSSLNSWGYASGSLSVAMDPNGDFVTAWTKSQSLYAFPYSVDYPFLGTHTVYARAYSKTGAPKSDVITVSAAQTGYNECSTVAMNRWGDFTVATTFGDQPGFIYLAAGGHYTVQLQHYSARGVAQGAPIVATQFDNSSLQSQLPMSCASIAMNLAGDFSLAWRDPVGNINLQQYKPRTTTAPTTQTLASYPDLAVDSPSAVIDSAGHFGAVWGHLPDGFNMTLYGQWFNFNGTAMAPPFTLESSIPSYFSAFGLTWQTSFLAASDAKGNLGLVWNNEANSLTAEQFSGF